MEKGDERVLREGDKEVIKSHGKQWETLSVASFTGVGVTIPIWLAQNRDIPIIGTINVLFIVFLLVVAGLIFRWVSSKHYRKLNG